MLACSDGPPLILGTGDPHQLAPPEGAAVGAGDLTVVTRSADADLARAAHAAEETSLLIDHRTRTGDISGHGPGVERWSTSERRLDHRDDPEGSGRLPRAFALSAVPSGYPTRPAPPRKPPQPPRTRCRAASDGHPWAPCKLAHERPTDPVLASSPGSGSATTWASHWTTAPPPSSLTTDTTWISMSSRSRAAIPRTPPAPQTSRDRSPAIPLIVGPSMPGGDTRSSKIRTCRAARRVGAIV